MRYIKSNPEKTEWYVMWTRGAGKEEVVVSRHNSYTDADRACWPTY